MEFLHQKVSTETYCLDLRTGNAILIVMDMTRGWTAVRNGLIFFTLIVLSLLMGPKVGAQFSGPAFWKKRSVVIPSASWIKTLGGSGSDAGYSVAVDNNGSVYAAGCYLNNSTNTNVATDFANNALNGKTTTAVCYAFVAKLDASGGQIWIKSLGGTGGATVNSLALDSSGNIYVTGGFLNTSTNANSVTDFAGNVLNGKTTTANYDVFVAKLDSSGNQQWIKTLGGTDNDRGNSIAVDSSANSYVLGFYTNTSTNTNTVTDFAGNVLGGKAASASDDIFVTKLDASGTQQWIKTLGGAADDDGNGLALDGAGNLYVVGGHYNTSANVNAVTDFAGNALNGKTTTATVDVYLAKLSTSAGAQLWIRTLGGKEHDYGRAVAADSSGNVYVTGSFKTNAANVDAVTDFAGTALSAKTSTTGYDSFVTKLDTSGTQQWIRVLGGTNDDDGSAITVDGSGNVYVTGGYRNSTTNGNSNTDYAGNVLNGKSTVLTKDDAFVVKLNASGTQQWIKTLGGANTDSGAAIGLDVSGNIYVLGGYRNDNINTNAVTDFAGSALNGKTSTASTEVFVVKNP